MPAAAKLNAGSKAPSLDSSNDSEMFILRIDRDNKNIRHQLWVTQVR